MHLLAAVAVKKTFFHALRRLGGPGLIVLGLVDNSAIPVPGSMDVFTIVLAAAHRDLWWYYALMATIGSLLGGYITYRLGVKGGKELLEKRISAKRAKRVYEIFDRYGFWSVVVGSVSPPPVPIVPFLVAAGSMRYSRQKFLAALALGRGLRYTLVAYLGSIYGGQIIGWLGRYYEPILYFLIFLAIAGGVLALILWLRHRRPPAGKSSDRASSRKAA